MTVLPHFSLNKNNVNIRPSESYQLGIESVKEDLEIEWSTTDPSIAYVNKCGLVTSMGIEGECDITAENMGEEITCHVKVQPLYPAMPENLNYTKGDNNTITITESPNATGVIVIPEQVFIDGEVYTVTSLGERAFADAYEKITSIYVPNTVTSIAKHAFIHCEGLEYLHLGSELTSIGEGALGFAKIDVMEIEAVTPPTLDIDCFWNCTINTLRVPMGSENAYKTTSFHRAYGWSEFGDKVVGYDFSNANKMAARATAVVPTSIVYESVTANPFMLNVRLEPIGATTMIDWQTSDPSVATIDHGLITFLSNTDKVKFTATTDNGMTAESNELSIGDISAGISDIIVNDNDCEAEYYNLNGIRVNANGLTPGLYIKRHGNNSEKVIVK